MEASNANAARKHVMRQSHVRCLSNAKCTHAYLGPTLVPRSRQRKMPRIASFASSLHKDKENVPQFLENRDKNHERKIASRTARGHIDDEMEMIHGHAAVPRSRNGSNLSQHTRPNKMPRTHEKEEYETANTDTVEYLREKLLILTKERDEVQEQFDELRELRLTEPERTLSEWKKVSEKQKKYSEDYIKTLKKQVAALEKHTSSSSTVEASSSNDRRLEQQLSQSQQREARLQEKLELLSKQLEQSSSRHTPTSRMAMQARVGSGALSGSDERAVRRLYEDLTGLVVNKVEQIDPHAAQADGHRRFHAIFACAGYHDLEVKLEESLSDFPTSVATQSSAGLREDLVYTPHFDVDRDAELLQSGRLPDYLKENIRFERTTAVKFLNTLHKRLDRHAKK